MSDETQNEAPNRPRALALGILQRLIAFHEGDAEALESLAELLQGGRVSTATVRAALGLLAEALEAESPGLLPRQAGDPRRRVLTARERLLLTDEAQGYLIRLTVDGRLGGEELEHVLARAEEQVERVDVALLQEIVWQVTLGKDDNDLSYEADRYLH